MPDRTRCRYYVRGLSSSWQDGYSPQSHRDRERPQGVPYDNPWEVHNLQCAQAFVISLPWLQQMRRGQGNAPDNLLAEEKHIRSLRGLPRTALFLLREFRKAV